MLPEVRRIVTGHDKKGFSIIVSDGPPERVTQRAHFGNRVENEGLRFQEVWATQEAPAPIDARMDEPEEAELLVYKPAKGGTKLRVMDYPPRDRPTSHHRREQIEYAVIMTGQIYMMTDLGETLCQAGDVVIQRGTNHAWWNRFDETCRIAFTLVDGEYVDELEGWNEENDLAKERTASNRAKAIAAYDK